MKRFLIIVLVVALAVVMMAVPVFAASSYEIFGDCSGPSLNEIPPEGYYVVRCYYYDGVAEDYLWAYTEPFYWNAESWDDPNAGDPYLVRTVLTVQGEEVDAYVGLCSDCGCGGFYGICVKYLSGGFFYLEGAEWEAYEAVDPGGSSGSPLSSVGSVFGVISGIGTWFVTGLVDFASIFYQADTGLTLLGVLAVCGLGLAVVFLLIGWIRNMLHLRH